MKHFSFAEMVHTGTGLPNVPDWDSIHNLERLITHVLDPLREAYGKPIRVTSGYRCPAVNAKVGGSPTSDHLRGMAADIDAGSREENVKMFDLIQKICPKWKQLIDERDYSWIHIAFDINSSKGQVLHLKK